MVVFDHFGRKNIINYVFWHLEIMEFVNTVISKKSPAALYFLTRTPLVCSPVVFAFSNCFSGKRKRDFFDLFAIRMRKLIGFYPFLVAKSIPSQKVKNTTFFRARSARKSKIFRARSARKQRKRKGLLLCFWSKTTVWNSGKTWQTIGNRFATGSL